MDKLPAETKFADTIDDYTGGLEHMLSDVAKECHSVNKLPKKQDRNQRLLDAFNETFEVIGGVARMSLWADSNPGEFYKLWGKQIPGMIQQLNFNGPTQINIQPALPRSPLDGPEDAVYEDK
jgi:hypothetical protein